MYHLWLAGSIWFVAFWAGLFPFWVFTITICIIVLLKNILTGIYLLVGTQFVGINLVCMKLSLEQLEGNKEHLQRQHACPPLSHCSASKRGVFLFASNSCVNCCDDLCIGYWWQEKIGGSFHVTWTSIGNKIPIWGAVLSCHEGTVPFPHWSAYIFHVVLSNRVGFLLQVEAHEYQHTLELLRKAPFFSCWRAKPAWLDSFAVSRWRSHPGFRG